MSRKRFTAEQIIHKLRQAEVELANGQRVVGHSRVDAVHGLLEVAGDLTRQEEPFPRLDGWRKMHAPHVRVKLLVVQNLPLLVGFVRNEGDQVGRCERPRHHEPLDFHRASRRRNVHVLFPDAVPP